MEAKEDTPSVQGRPKTVNGLGAIVHAREIRERLGVHPTLRKDQVVEILESLGVPWKQAGRSYWFCLRADLDAALAPSAAQREAS